MSVFSWLSTQWKYLLWLLFLFPFQCCYAIYTVFYDRNIFIFEQILTCKWTCELNWICIKSFWIEHTKSLHERIWMLKIFLNIFGRWRCHINSCSTYVWISKIAGNHLQWTKSRESAHIYERNLSFRKALFYSD